MFNWRLVVGLLAVAAYALLSHALMVHAADRPWAVLAIFAPLLVAVFGVAWRRRHGPTLLATLALVGVLALVVARGGVGDVNRLYVAQHVGIHLALCVSFALSLRGAGLSLIGRMATQLHGRITPDMQAYTHRLTGLWAIYFLGMALVSLVIYASFAWQVWSLFANIATPLSALLFFVGEHFVRYTLHPEFERATLADALRAYSRSGEPERP